MNGKNLSFSIVIPSYNGKRLLAKNLPAVVAACPDAEIIVVDDASIDDTVAFLQQEYPKIKVIQLKQNIRFAGACNAGIENASSDLVVLLNNDVQPQVDYLEPIVKIFEDEDVFAIGFKELNPTDWRNEAAGRASGAYTRGLILHWKAKDQTAGPSLWASGGSACFKRNLWLALGGMDRRFSPSYEEDRDICYRALKRGYKVLFEPQSQVSHYHETTNEKVLGKRLMRISSYKNQLLLVWKNISDPSWVLKHILWLPYHLVFTGIYSRGEFILGFIWALRYLPQILWVRLSHSERLKRSDHEVLAVFKAL